MLVYRYIIVLLKETERMTDAYMLRSPGQKGLHYKVWGTMVGQLLLRSMDRAQIVYDSMRLRGYCGEFHLRCKKAAQMGDYQKKNKLHRRYSCVSLAACGLRGTIRKSGRTAKR